MALKSFGSPLAPLPQHRNARTSPARSEHSTKNKPSVPSVSRWSWIFTRNNNVNGIIYWDNVGNRWVCADADTKVIVAELTTNTKYPIGTNDEWVDINSGTCLSVSNGLSTWTIPCELCPSPTPQPCEQPDDVSAEGSFK